MPADAPEPSPIKTPETVAMLRRLAEVKAERRFLRLLDNRHAAAFAEAGDTLVVTFERTEGLLATGDAPMPRGHDLFTAFGWSFLTILMTGDTWARSDGVVRFFDHLIDRGFFDRFERVVFYGAGTSAHAACAYSVAAPGATVIAISPQATLSPLRSGFDDRFRQARRLDFTSRYGYAPDMLDGAEAAHILYDPAIAEDAAHAAQFNASHITLHRLRHFGENPEQVLAQMDALMKLFQLWDEGGLDAVGLARLLRERRTNRNYLMRLVDHAQQADRPLLAAILCNYAYRTLRGPRFLARRNAIVQDLAERGITVPFVMEDAPEPAREPAPEPSMENA